MAEQEKAQPDMQLEVVVLGVSNCRAEEFYENLGWRLDIDVAMGDDFRAVQVTPHNSEGLDYLQRSHVGQARLGAQPGPRRGRHRHRPRRPRRRRRRPERVFHYTDGPFNNAVENPRVSGRDPEKRSYFSFASFDDPDESGWPLQETKKRLPGREWKLTRARATDVATLAEVLHGTAEHHDHYEKTHAQHH